MKKYDLAVIGSGSGLMIIQAALAYGLKCAIVERSKFGGTCLTQAAASPPRCWSIRRT